MPRICHFVHSDVFLPGIIAHFLLVDFIGSTISHIPSYLHDDIWGQPCPVTTAQYETSQYFPPHPCVCSAAYTGHVLV